MSGESSACVSGGSSRTCPSAAGCRGWRRASLTSWNPESTFTGGALDSTPSRLTGRSACAAAHLEDEGDHYRYRYAVLYGGEAAVRALRTAALDPRDSDEPGPNRRVALAAYPEYEDFIYRLPTFLSDVARRLEEQLARAERLSRRPMVTLIWSGCRESLQLVRRSSSSRRRSDGVSQAAGRGRV